MGRLSRTDTVRGGVLASSRGEVVVYDVAVESPLKIDDDPKVLPGGDEMDIPVGVAAKTAVGGFRSHTDALVQRDICRMIRQAALVLTTGIEAEDPGFRLNCCRFRRPWASSFHGYFPVQICVVCGGREQ